jgi:hypothetical protein
VLLLGSCPPWWTGRGPPPHHVPIGCAVFSGILACVHMHLTYIIKQWTWMHLVAMAFGMVERLTPDDYQEQRTTHCCRCLNPTPYIVANAAVYGSAAHGHKVQEPEHSIATCKFLD